MKKRMQEKKFRLEKFEIAKLTNLRKIYGGTGNENDGNDDTLTNGDKPLKPKETSVMCLIKDLGKNG